MNVQAEYGTGWLRIFGGYFWQLEQKIGLLKWDKDEAPRVKADCYQFGPDETIPLSHTYTHHLIQDRPEGEDVLLSHKEDHDSEVV